MKRRSHPTPKTGKTGRYQTKQRARLAGSPIGAALTEAQRRNPTWQPRGTANE